MKIQKVQTLGWYRLAAGLILLLAVMVVFLSLPKVAAMPGQAGAEQVTLNPGGGVQTNGSDGMRFTVNSAAASGNPDYAVSGGDGVVYKNTYQYCCSAGGPVLNIGGTSFGQAGAAQAGSVAIWSSISILSTSGTASVGTRTASKGNASATIRYTAEKNGLTYTMDRELSYTYPNDFVSDKYTFTIPDGNTDAVKFYLGGDTAPGSSDQGYGIVLTQPVRSIISLNTSSQIMFGFRENPSSKAFDGATSQHYSAPYTAVRAGGNIGFVETASNHDAGLMMQWNLGSTPGTQTASLEQFVTSQGTNLGASFSASKTAPNTPVNLSISAANTVLSPVNDLDFTFTLPAGLKIGSGLQSNSCDGTVTAVAGSSTIELVDGEVGSGTNCVITVPVLSSTNGTYTISSSSVTAINNMNNNVGSSSLLVTTDNDSDGIGDDIEAAGPNSGDGNDDGILDSTQLNVTSLVNAVTGQYSTISAGSGCELSDVSVKAAANLASDAGYTYPMGLFDFSANCGTPGFTTTITQYFYGQSASDFVLRKFANGIYRTVDGATFTSRTIGGQNVLVVSYEVVDGGPLDADGVVNGIVVDPAGPAQSVPGAPNTGVGPGGFSSIIFVAFAGIVSAFIGVIILARLKS